MTRIELDGGKYTVCHENGTNLRALRNGEPWRELTGDGLVLAMAQRIEDLTASLKHMVACHYPDANGQIGAQEECWDSLQKAKSVLATATGDS